MAACILVYTQHALSPTVLLSYTPYTPARLAAAHGSSRHSFPPSPSFLSLTAVALPRPASTRALQNAVPRPHRRHRAGRGGAAPCARASETSRCRARLASVSGSDLCEESEPATQEGSHQRGPFTIWAIVGSGTALGGFSEGERDRRKKGKG